MVDHVFDLLYYILTWSSYVTATVKRMMGNMSMAQQFIPLLTNIPGAIVMIFLHIQKWFIYTLDVILGYTLILGMQCVVGF